MSLPPLTHPWILGWSAVSLCLSPVKIQEIHSCSNYKEKASSATFQNAVVNMARKIQKERTFSDILLLTPRSINMLSHSVTPIAYRSLKTLAQAILPCKTEATELGLNQHGWKENTAGHYHHVRVIYDGVDIVCCLDQRKASMSEGNDTRVHADAFNDKPNRYWYFSDVNAMFIMSKRSSQPSVN